MQVLRTKISRGIVAVGLAALMHAALAQFGQQRQGDGMSIPGSTSQACTTAPCRSCCFAGGKRASSFSSAWATRTACAERPDQSSPGEPLWDTMKDAPILLERHRIGDIFVFETLLGLRD